MSRSRMNGRFSGEIYKLFSKEDKADNIDPPKVNFVSFHMPHWNWLFSEFCFVLIYTILTAMSYFIVILICISPITSNDKNFLCTLYIYIYISKINLFIFFHTFFTELLNALCILKWVFVWRSVWKYLFPFVRAPSNFSLSFFWHAKMV